MTRERVRVRLRALALASSLVACGCASRGGSANCFAFRHREIGHRASAIRARSGSRRGGARPPGAEGVHFAFYDDTGTGFAGAGGVSHLRSRHERGAAGPVGPLGVRRPRPRRRPRVSLLALAIETAPGRLYGSMGLLSTVKYSGSTLFTHHTANSATSNRGEMQTRAQAGRGLVTCVGSHQTSVWVHYGCQVASAQQVPSSQPCYAGERRIAGALWPLRPFSAPTPEHRMPRHVATQLLLVPDSARR